MSDTPPASPTPAPAATVLLVRDAPSGLEVFMVQRHHRIEFAGGAMVFPGGKVEPGDADPALAGHCAGVEGLPGEARAFRVAALRELFEECAVLLARSPGQSELLPFARLADLLKRYRGEVQAHRVSIGQLARAERLELACDLLVPFAHWITPEPAPKRFDTHFFLVQAPPQQFAAHDGTESVDSVWIAPAQALEDARAGRRSIVFPTRLNLAKLARSKTAAEALAAARASRVVTVLPRVEIGPSGPVVRIPADAGYDVTEAPVDSIMRG